MRFSVRTEDEEGELAPTKTAKPTVKVAPEILEALKKRFGGLAAIGEKPGREAAQKRGRDFEELLLDLFDAHRILLRRSFHTADGRSEQIDGAIEIAGRVALVEAKWVESGLAASDLFAFLGKVEGKFVGTIGVFVSREELSGNFITALRAGRRQSILVIHGPDVERVFDPAFELGDYLRDCVHHVSIDNEPHLPAATFSEQRKLAAQAATTAEKPDVTKLLASLSQSSVSVAAMVAAEKDGKKLAANVESLISVFPHARTSPGSESLVSTMSRYVEEAVKKLPQSELDVDREFFENVFPVTILDPAYEALHGAMATRLPFLSQPLRETTGSVLLAAWGENEGEYEKENVLAAVTDPLWPGLSTATRHTLLRMFVRFVNSYRRSNFPQMTLARRKVKDPANKSDLDVILAEMVREEMEKMADPDADLAWKKKWTLHSFENVGKLIGTDEMTAIVDSVGSELANGGTA